MVKNMIKSQINQSIFHNIKIQFYFFIFFIFFYYIAYNKIMSSPHLKKEFIATENSPLYFGKFKGKTHKELLKPENKDYVKWILQTDENFATATKTFLKSKNLK